MRFLILSDLHVEVAALAEAPAPPCDAVILAGDIHSPASKAVEWMLQRDWARRGLPVIYVPGNHEYYRCTYQEELARARAAASGSNVRLLSTDEALLQGADGEAVRVLGATLWTDFGLPVVTPQGDRSDPDRALCHADQQLGDFYRIAFAPELATVDAIHVRGEVQVVDGSVSRATIRPRRFRAQDSLQLHRRERAWLEQRLAQPFEGLTIVVTHHAPARGSVASAHASSWLSPAFVSDLSPALFEVPCLWVHGHTHTSFDYRVNDCRVVCNPRGYAVRGARSENPHFDPSLVIDVRTASTPA